MLLNTDYITPTELTGFVREALADRQQNQFTLSRWLPNRLVDDLDYRFTRGGEGLVDAATFRSYDAESPIGARPGLSRVSGELPPISRKVRLGEYDRLRQRHLDQQVTDALMTDAERMTRAVAARVEMARGDALTTGKVTIAENGVTATVDFGRAAGHTVTAATPWSTVASATPLADMITWRDTYRATNGENPGVALISTTILGYLLRNAEIRALAATVAGTPTIVSQAAVAQVWEAYGLPPFEIYDAQVRVAGTATRIVPADKVLLLPAAGDTELGATLYGTTAESLDPAYGVEGDEPGIVAGVYSTQDPIALWTKAAAISLPILANPDLSFAADVA